ncbi:MAG TPA: hypothetical protein DCY20_11615 [Firmicutes bacterium]|nr:hypothetical protein [Bacillota bacterium]
MKKILACMSLLVLFIFTGCSKTLEESPNQDIAENTMVKMSVISASTENLTVELTNQSDEVLTYGAYIQLEVKENGSWKVVPVVEGMGWDDMGYLLEPDQTIKEDSPLNLYYGTLAKGEYRVIKQLYGTEEPLTVAAEFVLK